MPLFRKDDHMNTTKLYSSAIAKLANCIWDKTPDACKFLKSRSYKKHLKSVAEGMAGRHNIRIKFLESGDDLGFTDGKVIYVNLFPKCLMGYTVRDLMCAHIALIVHEHSHQLYSSWDIIRKVAGKELLKDINNILEDGRIERISAFKVPGWSPSLYRLNEIVSEVQTKGYDTKVNTDFQYLYWWLWEYSKVGHTPPNDFPSEEVKKAWKEIKQEILKARYSDTPEPCYEAALKIEEILTPFKQKQPTPKPSEFIRSFSSEAAQGKDAQTGQQIPQQSGGGQGQQSGSQQSRGQQTTVSVSSGSGSSQQSAQQSSSNSNSDSSSASSQGTSQEQTSGAGGSSSSNEQNSQNNDTNGSSGSSSSKSNEDENGKDTNSSSGGSDSDNNEEKGDKEPKSNNSNGSDEEKSTDGEKNDKSDKSDNSSDKSENGDENGSDSKGEDAESSDEKKDSDSNSEKTHKTDVSDEKSDKEGDDGNESDENSDESGDKEDENKEETDEEEDLNDLNKGLDDFLDRLDDELDSTAEDYEDEKEAEQKDNGFANTVPAYNRTSYDEHMEERYNERKARLAGLISNMKTKLFKTIHFNMDETTKKLTRGKVDSKSLCNVINGRICAQRKEKSDETDLNVTFLLDSSGSMDGYLETTTIDATIIVGEALEMLKIPYSILAFENSVYLYKEWRQSKARKYALMNYSADGGTALDSGLQTVTEMIKKQMRYDRIVFVITDGYPNNTEAAVRSAEILRNTKTQVYGIAIGEIARNANSRKTFTRIFGDKFYIPCAKLEDLPLQLTKVVRKNLLR